LKLFQDYFFLLFNILKLAGGDIIIKN